MTFELNFKGQKGLSERDWEESQRRNHFPQHRGERKGDGELNDIGSGGRRLETVN